VRDGAAGTTRAAAGTTGSTGGPAGAAAGTTRAATDATSGATVTTCGLDPDFRLQQHRRDEAGRVAARLALGGPEGATWNWYGSDLVCRVVVDADCDGKGRTVLKLGRSRAPVARGTLALARGQAANLSLRVPAKTWQRALERPKKALYQKLTVAVQVSARCTGGGPERRWSDSFVGGFAGGE